MATQEAFTLDSLALNDGTTIAVLSADAPPPRQRQDWIGAADSEAQLLTRTPLHENRKVTLRCVIVPQASMDLAHDKILLVVDKLQKASRYQDGIALTWAPATGTRTVTFDVLAGEITDLPIDWENGWLAYSPQFTIELTCKPYWRGAETLTSTASSSTPFVAMEIPSVTGDVPALGRLIVTDTATQSRRHVEWGLEGPLTYNNATSLLIDSDDMVTSGFAGSQTTGTGAYDPNAAGNNAITLTLGGALTTAFCGTGNLSHVGVFRVKARITAGSLDNQFRLSWRAGDGPMQSNAWVKPVSVSNWVEMDLGTITVPPAVVGSQRWTGQLEVLPTATTPGTAYLDYMILVPAKDGYGKARASTSSATGVVAGYDSFTSTTAGVALSARAAPAGGSWATSGDATDFTFDDDFLSTPADANESVRRQSAVSETSGRYAILGTSNYTDVQVQVKVINFAASLETSVIARWTDANNYLRLRVPTSGATPTTETAYLEHVVAGAVTVMAQATWTRTTRAIYLYKIVAYVSGHVIGSISTLDGSTVVSFDGSSSVVATAGALATGKPGFRDRSTGTLGARRNYDDFAVSVPAAEPIALYSGRNMQIRHDDVLRQDSAGTYSGRPPAYRGSRFLVPVGTSRVLVKARRNDTEVAADDTVTDATQIQVGWTPRGIAVPR